MAHVGRNSGSSSRKSDAPSVPAIPNMGATAEANPAVLQARNVLGSQFKEIAEQIASPSSSYAALFAGISAKSMFDAVGAANRMSTANLAVRTLASNPACLEATRELTKSFGVQHTSALSKVLEDLEASGAFTHASERWAAQQGKLLVGADLQFLALSKSLLAGVAHPANDALLCKFADLARTMNVRVGSSLAAQNAASIAARSVTLGLSEQLRSSGTVSPAWHKLFQDLQLADGLGSVARLTATPGPLFRSELLASGADSYASVQRVLSDLARDQSNAFLRGRSLQPAAALNSYFDSLGARPWRRRTELAGLVGSATSGLVLGESLTAELHDDDADLLIRVATTELVEPWKEGFDETRADLFAALEALSPHLANLLRGAWFNIKANGPAAAASAANCLVEVVDQTLYALVDESLLPEWLSDHGCLGREYVDVKSGRPTRRARLAYALQTRSKRDTQLLRGLEVGLASSLSPLHSQLESGKHGRVDIGVQAVRCHAIAVEGFLINLLLG
jgi:hypothetical protein